MSLSKFQITTKPRWPAVKLFQPWWEVSRVPALLLLCSEEPATTVALVSTFTGVPSTTGSPANLSSKISMDQRCLHARGGDGTPHHHHPVYQSASKSVRPPCPGCFHPRPDSQRCSHHCPARLPCLHCTGLQSVLSAPVFQSQLSSKLPTSQFREPETRGERREEETTGRRGPTTGRQGSATLDRSLRVSTPVLPSPPSPSWSWPDVRHQTSSVSCMILLYTLPCNKAQFLLAFQAVLIPCLSWGSVQHLRYNALSNHDSDKRRQLIFCKNQKYLSVSKVYQYCFNIIVITFLAAPA